MPVEQRSSQRLPVTQDIAPAAVRVGDVDYAGRLVNESAGGIELTIDGQPSVGVGERVRVQLYSGCYEMEVVRVEMSDAGTGLGLKRRCAVPELVPLADVRRGRLAASSVCDALFSKRAVGMGLLVLLGLCLPAIADRMGGKHGLANLAGTTSLPQAPRPVSRMEQTLHSLGNPAIYDQLGLEHRQRHSIDLIFQDTSQSLGRLYEVRAKVPPQRFHQQSGQLVERAVQRVLCTMTEDQVLKWRKVLANSPDMRQ